jgi:hypothetical protein
MGLRVLFKHANKKKEKKRSFLLQKNKEKTKIK